MQRLVSPEQLDHLPHTDPAAIRSRLELRGINALMGNHRWLVRELQRSAPLQGPVLELGAGDGRLLEKALRARAIEAHQWMALDLAPAPHDWPPVATWHQTDLLRLQTLPEAEVVVANLFLHHFEPPALARIGSQWPSSCRLILANEPTRAPLHRMQGRCLSWLVNLSAVTRHDMECSIEAGFQGNELPDWLGLHGWQVRITRTLLGAYRMRAWR
ncbi:MAG: hypothetical protein RLZZ142_1566 [Verrucomicrobiota bacterium]